MLTNKLRPSVWSDVIGQKENIRILKAIVKSPETSPKTIILEGEYGTGKTTLVRILAKELNGIKDPNYDLSMSPFYYEYDATVIGNVEEIRKLRDVFGAGFDDYWKVIVFDECMSYDTEIVLEDGTSKKIGDIVENRERVKVLSYNSGTGKVESKCVTGWFKNNPKVFYTVKTTKQKGFLRCSDNHVFITPEGEKTLSQLTINSDIYRYDGMNVIKDKITSISMYNVAPQDSYDIEVEDNHNYFAGGILVHNCHAVSQQAQTALLKILEEVKTKTIFCLCTTHVHKVLPTIRSRSLELKFDRVPFGEIVEHLGNVAEKLEVNIPDDIKEIIASRSYGHMRNVHMLVDKFLMIGEGEFRETVVSSLGLLCDYFRAVKSNNMGEVIRVGNELMAIPLEDIKYDFSNFILEGMKCLNGENINNPKIHDIIKLYGPNFMNVVKFFFSDWFSRIFDSDIHLKSGLMYFYSVLKADMPVRSENVSTASRLGINRRS